MAIVIRGPDKLFKKLGNAQAVDRLERPMQRGVLRLQRRMQEYPPALASSAYRRTGTYGRKWTTRVTKSGNGIQGRVGNNVYYGPFVGSERFQARVHRGRWNTDRRVVEQEQAAIVADFAREVDRALGE